MVTTIPSIVIVPPLKVPVFFCVMLKQFGLARANNGLPMMGHYGVSIDFPGNSEGARIIWSSLPINTGEEEQKAQAELKHNRKIHDGSDRLS